MHLFFVVFQRLFFLLPLPRTLPSWCCFTSEFVAWLLNILQKWLWILCCLKWSYHTGMYVGLRETWLCLLSVVKIRLDYFLLFSKRYLAGTPLWKPERIPKSINLQGISLVGIHKNKCLLKKDLSLKKQKGSPQCVRWIYCKMCVRGMESPDSLPKSRARCQII